ACMQLVTKPQQFDVIVTENLYGDILSDLCAGLVGGLGVVPGANIGDKAAIFEAVHGSAPDIAGQNKANPTALLQSAVMMLQHIGEAAKADQIMKALVETLADINARTGDLGGKGTTASFTDAIIQKLG
ncbi:MAG TPA: isocitrate/isopropylmalate family dehydrogenase, partial [Bdellovibrio sp.]|nr:isocitrate/isopropylmalate family dehydrogenase [Bdellovibrio sp.]